MVKDVTKVVVVLVMKEVLLASLVIIGHILELLPGYLGVRSQGPEYTNTQLLTEAQCG